VTSFFKPLTSLTQIAFDLTDSLSVDSVYYRGQAIQSYTHSGNALTVSFADIISGFDSVTVYYSGSPPITGFGSFTTDLHDSVPELWTLSEPYGSRDWFPGKMTLTDKVDSLDFYINVPIGNKAASNGLLLDTLQVGNTVTYHWHEGYPIANYLIAMAVTNYTAYSYTVPTQYGNISVLNYVYPESLADWHSTDSLTGAALQLYSTLFGQYPFIKEKYGHAQFGWGGGMEHQTMSFMYNSGFELVNHEMAHQWFGDKLTCGSWSDIWLNEGFAVYLAGLCFEYIQPDLWSLCKSGLINYIKLNGKTGSVYCTDTNSVPRIFVKSLSYFKGAYLLHMLRWELGDSAFFSGLRGYVSDSTLVYSFSKTQMLKQHLETAGGRDLTVFFDNWYYGSGYPSYTLDWSNSGSLISCSLSQITSDPSVSFYPMDVPVRFYGDNIDTTVILGHTSSGQQFSFDISFPIDSVVIDPDLKLLSAYNTVRKLPSLGAEDFVIIYPNPVLDQMTIWYDSQNLYKASYAIYDMAGEKVMEGSLPEGNDYYMIPMPGLAQGVYVIRVNTEQGNRSQRIVKY
jgi:aminopeptidase N